METKERAWVAITISDKTDFKSNCNKRQKDHYIMIKGSIHQKYMTFENICPNRRIPKHRKEIITQLKKK